LSEVRGGEGMLMNPQLASNQIFLAHETRYTYAQNCNHKSSCTKNRKCDTEYYLI